MLLETLVNATPAITKLLSKDLPIILAFRLGTLVKIVDPYLKSYNEARTKMIEKYVPTADEKGNRQVPVDQMKQFAAELTVVLQEEIKVEGIPEVKLSDLEGIKMNAQEMASITPWLIKE